MTVAVGLGVRAVFEGSTAKYAGDLLYTLLVYALVMVVRPGTSPRWAAVFALAVSWLVEFAQLTGIPAALSAHSLVARLVLGTTFNPPDLVWYTAGALLGCAVHTALRPENTPLPHTSERSRHDR